MNLKKVLSALVVMLFFLSLDMTVYSQDVQHSFGPAPFVTNTAEESPIFDMAPTSRAFSYNATSLTASTLRKYFLGTPATSTSVGGVQAFFFGGGDFCPLGGSGAWTFYVIQQLTPFTLFTVDTATGTTTNLGNITGIIPGHVSGGVTSLAWDIATSTAYIASLTATVTQTQLYTLDLTTRVATPVGSPQSVAAGIITMGCNPAGTLFGIDIVNDRLFKIDKTTGAPTAVGSALGYNANYGQDSDFDPRDGIYYWAAIGQTQPSQIRTVDTSTGTSTLVGIMTGTSQVLATGIPYPDPVGGIQTIEVPNYYALEQNYPNPFNPSTVISFAIPKADNVKLIIYDMLGREVAAPVSEFRQAGIYKVPFDASSLSSGVYFYRLETGSFTETKKMLLMK
jgi:hypothetical protein